MRGAALAHAKSETRPSDATRGHTKPQQDLPTPEPVTNPLWSAIALGTRSGRSVGAADDPAEREADAIADQVLRASYDARAILRQLPDREGTIRPRCAVSGDAAMVRPRETPGARAPSISSLAYGAGLPSGRGAPLSEADRSWLEPGMGLDLSALRLHTDDASRRLARGLGARAFAVGGDIVLGAEFDTESAERRRHLLAHEVAHVVLGHTGNQRVRREPLLYDRVISRDEADAMSDRELLTTITALAERPLVLSDDAERIARRSLATLQFVRLVRSYGPALSGLPPGATVHGVAPISGLTPELVDSLPEGQVVAVPSALLADAETGSPRAASASEADTPPASFGLGTIARGAVSRGVGEHLRTHGLVSAGDNAIGIVAYPQSRASRAAFSTLAGRPRIGGLGPVLPDARILWGHTAVTVRQGGRVTRVLSFAPQTGLETLTNLGGIRSGDVGVPGTVISHLDQPLQPAGYMLDVPSARALEYRVPAEWADEFVAFLAREAPSGATDRLYTAMPEVCQGAQGTNCVGFAEDLVVRFLRQKDPDFRLGRSTQLEPLVDLRARGDAAVGAARQEQVIRFIDEVAEHPQRGFGLDTPEGYLRPVAGGASRTIRLIRFGGTVFQVAGAGYSVYRISNAAPAARSRVIGEEVGSNVGGAVGAPLGVGVCVLVAGLLTVEIGGVGIVVCGLGGGVAGGLAGDYVGGEVGEALGPDPIGSMVDVVTSHAIEHGDERTRNDARLIRRSYWGDTMDQLNLLQRIRSWMLFGG